jgi:hypothetical protein
MNHAHAKLAIADLKDRVRLLHDGDRDAFLAAPPAGMAAPDMPYVRDLLLPPKQMVQALTDWAVYWLEHGIDTEGRSLLTVATILAVQRLLELAVAWKLSGKFAW